MPSQIEIAEALGLTRQRVSVLVKQGMPIDSVEAAMAWREAREDERRRPAPIVELETLTDLTLEQSIVTHKARVEHAGEIWDAAMRGGDTNGPKYQSSYNAAFKTLIDLEAELERRRVANADFISAKEATGAMRELMAEVVNRLDKLALDCAEGCNPETPAKAVKVLEAWVRKTREDLSRAAG
jgi:hypothetical protein